MSPATLHADGRCLAGRAIATNTANDHSITETITRAGEDEPNVRQASVEVKVVSATTSEVLLLNGQYRKNVRKVEVSDSSRTKNRTYWFERLAFQWRLIHQQRRIHAQRPPSKIELRASLERLSFASKNMMASSAISTTPRMN